MNVEGRLAVGPLLWQHTLKYLAAEFGVEGTVQTEVVCLDPRLQWSQAKNIWQNAAIRIVFYTLGAPMRWLRCHFSIHQR